MQKTVALSIVLASGLSVQAMAQQTAPVDVAPVSVEVQQAEPVIAGTALTTGQITALAAFGAVGALAASGGGGSSSSSTD